MKLPADAASRETILRSPPAEGDHLFFTLQTRVIAVATGSRSQSIAGASHRHDVAGRLWIVAESLA